MEVKNKISNTAKRLAEIMEQKNMKQVDIINQCEPYLKKHDVKMNKSDISQYLSGKSEPNQRKLAVLSEALGVSVDWLMGYDTPMTNDLNNLTIYKNMSEQIGKGVSKTLYELFRDKQSVKPIHLTETKDITNTNFYNYVKEKTMKYKVDNFKNSFISHLQDLNDEDWETIERFTDVLIKIKEKI